MFDVSLSDNEPYIAPRMQEIIETTQHHASVGFFLTLRVMSIRGYISLSIVLSASWPCFKPNTRFYGCGEMRGVGIKKEVFLSLSYSADNVAFHFTPKSSSSIISLLPDMTL